jgi:hypothetical protein
LPVQILGQVPDSPPQGEPMAVRVVQTAVRGVRVAVQEVLLLLWVPQALAGGGLRGVAEHRVREGGELAGAVVSYALPNK